MNANNTLNFTLLDFISNFDTVAQIPALRGIANSAMAKCIGAIRQDIRDRTKTQRDEDNPQSALDQRNKIDEDNRRVQELLKAQDEPDTEMEKMLRDGIERTPAQMASLYHAIYDWAVVSLQTLHASKWDAPLNIKQMLEYMTNKTQPISPALVAALAKAAHTDEATILKMHELQALREREQLLEAAPEIILTFNGFGTNGYETAIQTLPPVEQHQFAIKTYETLVKAKDAVILRVMRSRKLADLASIPLLEEAFKAMHQWVENFESKHEDAIREAIDSGRSVRTLEDL